MKYPVKSLEWHRNGVSGVGFYVAILEDAENGDMVCVRFPGRDIRTAVLNTALVGEGNIKFGINSWRGDYYDGSMLEAIRAHMKEQNRKYFPKQSDAELEEMTEREYNEFLNDGEE